MRRATSTLILLGLAFALAPALGPAPASAAPGPHDGVYAFSIPIGSGGATFTSSCLSLSRVHGGPRAEINGTGSVLVTGEITAGSFSLSWSGRIAHGRPDLLGGHGTGTWHAVHLPRACGGKASESGRFVWTGTARGLAGVVVHVRFVGFAAHPKSSGGGTKAPPPAYVA